MTTATLSRGDQGRGPVRALALVCVFGIGLMVGLAVPVDRSRAEVAGRPASVAQPRPTAAPAPTESSDRAAATADESVIVYVAAIQNFRAAVAAHDPAMVALFRDEITALTTPTTVAAVSDRYLRLIASVSTAARQHDPRQLAAFRAQLSRLCAPPGFLASFPGCRSAVVG
jgi:hypothetical protein